MTEWKTLVTERRRIAPVAVLAKWRTFVGDRRVVNDRGVSIRKWILSDRASPVASTRDMSPLCYLPATCDDALALLRCVPACFVIWRTHVYVDPAPFGTVFVRFGAVSGSRCEDYVRRDHGSRLDGFSAFLGNNIYQDGCKFGSYLKDFFDWKEPTTVAIDPSWVGAIATEENAFVGWRDGKKSWEIR